MKNLIIFCISILSMANLTSCVDINLCPSERAETVAITNTVMHEYSEASMFSESSTGPSFVATGITLGLMFSIFATYKRKSHGQPLAGSQHKIESNGLFGNMFKRNEDGKMPIGNAVRKALNGFSKVGSLLPDTLGGKVFAAIDNAIADGAQATKGATIKKGIDGRKVAVSSSANAASQDDSTSSSFWQKVKDFFTEQPVIAWSLTVSVVGIASWLVYRKFFRKGRW
jgi:hypothetical protein